jgi:hypothetical protein
MPMQGRVGVHPSFEATSAAHFPASRITPSALRSWNTLTVVARNSGPPPSISTVILSSSPGIGFTIIAGGTTQAGSSETPPLCAIRCSSLPKSPIGRVGSARWPAATPARIASSSSPERTTSFPTSTMRCGIPVSSHRGYFLAAAMRAFSTIASIAHREGGLVSLSMARWYARYWSSRKVVDALMRASFTSPRTRS